MNENNTMSMIIIDDAGLDNDKYRDPGSTGILDIVLPQNSNNKQCNLSMQVQFMQFTDQNNVKTSSSVLLLATTCD